MAIYVVTDVRVFLFYIYIFLCGKEENGFKLWRVIYNYYSLFLGPPDLLFNKRIYQLR